MTRPHARGATPWPWWFALAGLVGGLVLAVTADAVVRSFALVLTGSDDGTAIPLLSTLGQDVAFVATALGLAFAGNRSSFAGLGIRPVGLRKGVLAATGAAAAFLAFTLVYTAIFEPSSRQTTLESLGVDQGPAALIAAAILVVLIAPFAEELLFRGLMYRALRSRLPATIAATVIGVLFASLHFTAADVLELLPLLAALGITFCLLYEWTGSLLPSIALHVLNNAISFAVLADVEGAAPVAVGAAVSALALCAVLARRGSAASSSANALLPMS